MKTSTKIFDALNSDKILDKIAEYSAFVGIFSMALAVSGKAWAVVTYIGIMAALFVLITIAESKHNKSGGK